MHFSLEQKCKTFKTRKYQNLECVLEEVYFSTCGFRKIVSTDKSLISAAYKAASFPWSAYRATAVPTAMAFCKFVVVLVLVHFAPGEKDKHHCFIIYTYLCSACGGLEQADDQIY